MATNIDLKIYIAGKITGEPNYKELFKETQTYLESQGCRVMNPAILPEGFTHAEYMKICYSMIDVCDAVLLLDNWTSSKGATMEHDYAIGFKKIILYQNMLNMKQTEDLTKEVK